MDHVSESVEQISLFRWAEFQSGKNPELKLLHHIPNGGHRNKATAKRLKAEGVKAGVPDIFLPIARGGYHGLYIELKAGKSKTSPAQDEWLSELSKQGYCTMVCHGWESAMKSIMIYLSSN